jgi:CubicO group peptidase (beta-lactamase class C family)
VCDDFGHAELVDEHTLFPTGSATKAFTATARGILVDDGKVQWDAPVSKYLTDVRFPTAELTAEVTIRDILSHRTGIADDFPAYWGTAASPMDLLHARFPSLAVHAGLREGFEYNNLMYFAGGEVVARASGT